MFGHLDQTCPTIRSGVYKGKNNLQLTIWDLLGSGEPSTVHVSGPTRVLGNPPVVPLKLIGGFQNPQKFFYK